MSLFLRNLITIFVFVIFSTVSRGAQLYELKPLGSLGGNSNGYAINASGQVAGYSCLNSNGSIFHAILYDGTLHDLGTLGGGCSLAKSINSRGQIVGYSYTKEGNFHAFMYDGTMHDLGTLGGPNSDACDINDQGQIVGSSTLADGSIHAFLYDGTMHDLGTLGGATSAAYGINSSGTIVGMSEKNPHYPHDESQYPFVYDGFMHDLDPNANIFGRAIDINDSGQIAINSDHAYLYDGTLHNLGGLFGSEVSARCINNLGQITGGFMKSSSQGFFYDGSLHDLNAITSMPAGWSIGEGWGINDSGLITGFAWRPDGTNEAVLLTPVPEPSTLVLLLTLIFGGLLWRRRSR